MASNDLVSDICQALTFGIATFGGGARSPSPPPTPTTPTEVDALNGATAAVTAKATTMTAGMAMPAHSRRPTSAPRRPTSAHLQHVPEAEPGQQFRFQHNLSRFQLNLSRFQLNLSSFQLNLNRFKLSLSRFQLNLSRFDHEATYGSYLFPRRC